MGTAQTILAEREGALRCRVPGLRGPGVVGVLQQLLQNWESIVVSVLQILADSLDVCAGKVTKAWHGRCSVARPSALADEEVANLKQGLMRRTVDRGQPVGIDRVAPLFGCQLVQRLR